MHMMCICVSPKFGFDLAIQPKICELAFSLSFWKFNCNQGGVHAC